VVIYDKSFTKIRVHEEKTLQIYYKVMVFPQSYRKGIEMKY